MNRSLFGYYYHDGFGWFRLFGRGLKWKNLKKHYLIFSERYGYSKGLTIGHWRIGILPYMNEIGLSTIKRSEYEN